MSQEDSEFWTRARHARDKLVDHFINHPDVNLIDIGYDLNAEGGEATERVVLRVHVRQSLAREALGLPVEIDGIPVRVVVADYRLD